jgi:hypothetical protein
MAVVIDDPASDDLKLMPFSFPRAPDYHTLAS